MSTVITGLPNAVSDSLTKIISGATNANPIVIQTTTAHLFSTGNVVSISGVLGNLAANGEWSIVVVDSTHFQLVGSSGSGAYAGGGSAVDKSLTPAFQIPSDGDDFDVASVNVALEALADRTQFLQNSIRTVRADSFYIDYASPSVVSASGNLVVPADAIGAVVRGWGGGGGGGGGSYAQGTDGLGAGGGGGGGAPEITIPVIPLTPNETLACVIGAGGNGGTGGASPATQPTNGSGGSNSQITSPTSGIYVFRGGGGGGLAPTAYFVSATHNAFSCGGAPVSEGPHKGVFVTKNDITALFSNALQAGGRGAMGDTPSNFLGRGNGEPKLFAGGTPGSIGGASSTYLGGGYGGGGGAGPGGGGVSGGNGGNGNSAGNASNGAAGSNAGNNTGAGGGGGGGSGCSNNAGNPGAGDGGNGGNGGSGLLVFYWIRTLAS